MNITALLILIGILFIYMHDVVNKSPPKVEYRFLPKGFDPDKHKESYKVMFDEQGPWVKFYNERHHSEV